MPNALGVKRGRLHGKEKIRIGIVRVGIASNGIKPFSLKPHLYPTISVAPGSNHIMYMLRSTVGAGDGSLVAVIALCVSAEHPS
jgi:hypothetical protein